MTGQDAQRVPLRGGKVYLVGAGPGSLDMLTLKGKQVLEKADVVVYDSLVGDEVLACIPEGARAVNAGKRSSHHNMEQDEISSLLAAEAAGGNTVVRLKGGDPFVFGRGGEELMFLAERGIPFEVIPGVTSAFAAPAYAGIPATNRDMCSSVHIVAGHRKNALDRIDYGSLVRAGGSLIFLMGMESISDIAAGLTEAGMDADTPAAVIEKASCAGQKTAAAPLSRLPEAAKAADMRTPAVIAVGEVCSLSYILSWREKLPLFGRKIIVTRPRGSDRTISEGLRELGAEVLEIPAIEVRRYEGSEMEGLKTCLGRLSSYEWIAFTSASGVRIFFDELFSAGLDARSLAGIRFAVIGPGTALELKKHGIRADLVPETYDSASLGEALARSAVPGDRILIARSSLGSRELTRALEKRPDIQADDIAIYDIRYVKSQVLDIAGLISSGETDCVVFTSASGVRGFAAASEGADLSGLCAVCIGKQTMAQADKYGMVTLCAAEATPESVIEAVMERFSE